MKLSMKTVVLAAALAAASMAQAATANGTLIKGGTMSAFGYTMSDLDGAGTLSFSSSLLGALNAGGIDVSAVAPATVNITRNAKNAYTAISAGAPVFSLSGSFDSTTNQFTVSNVGTLGGAKMVATADDLTNTGGELSITNLNVDLTSKTIYADLVGANGVGTKAHQALWTYGAISGPTVFDAKPGVVVSDNNVTTLKITTDAKNLMVQSLGLTDLGMAALNKITDYGSIASHISVTVAVPEPSSYALMAVGMLAVGAITRRRARA